MQRNGGGVYKVEGFNRFNFPKYCKAVYDRKNWSLSPTAPSPLSAALTSPHTVGSHPLLLSKKFRIDGFYCTVYKAFCFCLDCTVRSFYNAEFLLLLFIYFLLVIFCLRMLRIRPGLLVPDPTTAFLRKSGAKNFYFLYHVQKIVVYCA